MKHTDLPVNLSILSLTPQSTQSMRPVSALDIFDGMSENFHENGLFSIGIFGRVGSDERDTNFSYVDLKVEIFHPFIYKQLTTLKQMYGGIMSGKAYAIWDDKLKDFVTSDPVNGQTGLYFFMQHWQDINFAATGSDVRDLRIQLITKFKDLALMNKVLVLPAGLRDIEIGEGGRVKQGEINEFYRTLISISNAISTMGNKNSPILDQSRYSLMMNFNKVYDYLHDLLDGKNGFFQQKWGSRRIFNGTRNVATAMDTSSPHLDAPNSPDVNSTVMGLFQTMKGVLPAAKFLIMNGWMREVFNREAGTAQLINRTTLKRETVVVDAQTIDKWTTSAGVETVINSAQSKHRRLRPVQIGNHYVGLVYTSSDPTLWSQPVFKIFGDIDELPFERKLSRKDVRPITLYELLYLSGYKEWNKFPVFVTRYPVTGIDSIYPSMVYVKTTTVGQHRAELGLDWSLPENPDIALEYPDVSANTFMDTMAPHPSKISALGMDYDGDTSSANLLYTEESKDEVKHYLSTAAAYLSPSGGFKSSVVVETVERVLYNFTRER